MQVFTVDGHRIDRDRIDCWSLDVPVLKIVDRLVVGTSSGLVLEESVAQALTAVAANVPGGVIVMPGIDDYDLLVAYTEGAQEPLGKSTSFPSFTKKVTRGAS